MKFLQSQIFANKSALKTNHTVFLATIFFFKLTKTLIATKGSYLASKSALVATRSAIDSIIRIQSLKVPFYPLSEQMVHTNRNQRCHHQHTNLIAFVIKVFQKSKFFKLAWNDGLYLLTKNSYFAVRFFNLNTYQLTQVYLQSVPRCRSR